MWDVNKGWIKIVLAQGDDGRRILREDRHGRQKEPEEGQTEKEIRKAVSECEE